MKARTRSIRRTGRSGPGVRALIRLSLSGVACAVGLGEGIEVPVSLVPAHAGQSPKRVQARFRCPPARSSSTTRSKGFGFIASDDGQDVFLHASALPAGTPSLKQGTRLEFGVADGKKGCQALSVRVLDAPPSLAKLTRKPADDMAIIIEDLVKLLDGIGADLRRGRYPSGAHGQEGRRGAAQGRRRSRRLSTRTSPRRARRAPCRPADGPSPRAREPDDTLPSSPRAPLDEPDERLIAAHDLARAALLEITSAGRSATTVGYDARRRRGASRSASRTACPAIPAGIWTVSVAQRRGRAPTVLEAELLPGEGALLAPDWVPWSERLADYQAAQLAHAG